MNFSLWKNTLTRPNPAHSPGASHALPYPRSSLAFFDSRATHARKLLPEALAFVPSGFVLVRVPAQPYRKKVLSDVGKTIGVLSQSNPPCTRGVPEHPTLPPILRSLALLRFALSDIARCNSNKTQFWLLWTWALFQLLALLS